MNDTLPFCLDRLEFDAAELVAAHPLRLRNAHKQAIHALVSGTPARGRVGYSRWSARPLPAAIGPRRAAVEPVADVYDYGGDDAGVWHVNFADPRLFVAYGSDLLAQDELQALEHPVLGSLREVLVAAGLPAVTEDARGPTPVLVTGAARRFALDTAPSLERPRGLYGNRFAAARFDVVRGALTVLDPPTTTHLIAMAAPVGSGRYRREDFNAVLSTAFGAFAAAVDESSARWPGAPVEVRTGFWGCGAFGGNRTVMVALQLLAAQVAGVARVVFYAFDQPGLDDFRAGAACLERLLAAAPTVDAVLERMLELGLVWGVSDGN